MSRARNRRVGVKSPPSAAKRRRRPIVVPICAAVFAVLVGSWCLWLWYSAPAPPVVSLQEADPAVADVLDAARKEVWCYPYRAAVWARLGQLLLAHGYRAESNVCFAQAERLDPHDARWPYLQGSSVRLDDPETAIRHLQRAVALCGDVPDAPELCLAEVCREQNRLDEAEQYFHHVLQNDARNARAFLGLGRLTYERGDLRQALAYLDHSASSKLTQKASRITRAQIYHLLGDETAANRERTEAASMPEDPPWPDPFLEEALALVVGKQARLARLQMLNRQGRLAEARALAHRLEDQYPDIYWLVEGREQMDKGDLAAADKALREAVRLAPDSVDANLDLGTVLFKRKNYGAAAEYFQRVTELEPGYAPAYRNLGDCRRLQGNRAAAINAFRAALKYTPHNAEAHHDLGSLLAEEGQMNEALIHLRQALQLTPGDVKTRELIEQASKKVP